MINVWLERNMSKYEIYPPSKIISLSPKRTTIQLIIISVFTLSFNLKKHIYIYNGTVVFRNHGI